MKKTIAAFSMLFVSLCALAESTSLTTYQNTPQGWKTEIIPFPLEYAPEITYSGKEELVFLPGMYKAESEDFFSFAFSWEIDSATEQLNISQIKNDLIAYYVGLNKAVAKANAAEVDVSFIPERDGKWQYRGAIHWQEPFITQKPQVLNFKALSKYCSQQQKQRWYFIASPQPSIHQVWQTLENLNFTDCN